MNNKQKPARPILEIKAELSKSVHSKHPLQYVFVEGVDDVKIYSEIARKKDLSTQFTFEQLGGRIPLLQLHKEISSVDTLLSKTVFFADKDTFVFNSIPSYYETVYFTKGYSIENDLFEDGYDFLINELSGDENARFERLINNVSEWYTYEIEKLLSTKSDNTKISISGLNPNIVAKNSDFLEKAFLIERGYQQPSEAFCQKIKNDYKLLIRGKILFELMLRISFDRGGIHHKEVAAFWNVAITEGLRATESNCNRIISIFQNRLKQ